MYHLSTSLLPCAAYCFQSGKACTCHRIRHDVLSSQRPILHSPCLLEHPESSRRNTFSVHHLQAQQTQQVVPRSVHLYGICNLIYQRISRQVKIICRVVTTQFAEKNFKFCTYLRHLAIINADTVTFLDESPVLIEGELHRNAYSAMKFIWS